MPDAGRIIAGVARGIRLDAPGPATRPLADRVKQTLFAILEPDLPGANVLDLFAGRGAAGLEALSRGAAHATFVERDKAAAAIIATNLGRTHLAGARARIVRAEAIAWLGGPDAAAAGPFGIVVVDPPYAEVELLAAALDALAPVAGTGRARRGQALLARSAARPGGAASIGARAPLRRDDADVLSAPGGSMNTIAVYPGSFDPITNGHLDIVARAATVFDRVIIGVLANPRKTPLLPVETRIAVIQEALRATAGPPLEHLEVKSFDGLTVEFCRANAANAIVRGLRAISDFESEMQLAHNNRVLAPEVDTVFFMTSVENGYVSSSLVKEIAGFGGDIGGMVPAAARAALGVALDRR